MKCPPTPLTFFQVYLQTCFQSLLTIYGIVHYPTHSLRWLFKHEHWHCFLLILAASLHCVSIPTSSYTSSSYSGLVQTWKKTTRSRLDYWGQFCQMFPGLPTKIWILLVTGLSYFMPWMHCTCHSLCLNTLSYFMLAGSLFKNQSYISFSSKPPLGIIKYSGSLIILDTDQYHNTCHINNNNTWRKVY